MSIKMQETLNSDAFEQPGVYKILLPGLIGVLEVEINIPVQPRWDYVALLGHPHSLKGGTMHNKVVTTLSRVFSELQVPSIKFNFRGVGESFGEYDAGIGESEDLIHIAQWWLKNKINAQVLLAGFSFGSYVTYRASSLINPKLLISISPPVHHYDFKEFMLNQPWYVVQGDNDDVVPMLEVVNFVNDYPHNIVLKCFSDTGHFFHGKLIELKETLILNIKGMDLGL